MLTLYGAKHSRASIVQWYLEEISQPYTFVDLDLQKGEQHQDAFLEINPMGKVPALVDDTFYVWESGAILLYLADAYGSEILTAKIRAQLAQWVFYANATLSVNLFIESHRNRDGERLLGYLNSVLYQKDFLVENSFSIADVAVGSILAYALKMLTGMSFGRYPAIESYVNTLSCRPAFEKCIGCLGSQHSNRAN